MEDKKQKLINQIMQKAMKISHDTQTKVIVEYYGTVDSINIYISHNSKAKHFRTVYFEYSDAEEKLQKLLEELKKIGE